jgi:hypothetical protein
VSYYRPLFCVLLEHQLNVRGERLAIFWPEMASLQAKEFLLFAM